MSRDPIRGFRPRVASREVNPEPARDWLAEAAAKLDEFRVEPWRALFGYAMVRDLVRRIDASTADRQALRDALTAFGHHADDCEYALAVCTCGFTEAMRSLFEDAS